MVQYREKDSEKWLQAHYPVKINIKYGKKVAKPYETMATSILFLKENTEYEVKFLVDDPDGLNAQLPVETVRTKNSKVKSGTGTTYYLNYNATENGGGSKEKPLFVDETKADYRTSDKATSMIDKGQVVIGINDQVPSQYQFKGAAPDIGLLEVGEEAPHYGVKK